MSDNIPIDIQVEIIKRLPVKSLIQFRSVSKSWKSLIDSSDFSGHYSRHHAQLQSLIVSFSIYFSDYQSNNTSPSCRRKASILKDKYVSIVDDDTSSPQIVDLAKPLLLKLFNFSRIIGSAQGVLCLFGDCRKGCGSISRSNMALLWNVSIKKAIGVVVPNVAKGYGIYQTVIGFGVCRETNDPKIVKITHISRWTNIESVPDSSFPWQVEVFTLSTRAWRPPYSTNLPRKTVQLDSYKEVIDGVLYWLATDVITTDAGFEFYNLIVLIDMTSEEFREVNLPQSLAHQEYARELSMSKLRESLVFLKEDAEANSSVFTVWMMEDAVLKSFTKLFTFSVKAPDELTSIQMRGFRKSGEPVIEFTKDNRGKLAVYKPYSKQYDYLLGMNGNEDFFSVYTYMETLLLLDQPNLTVYNGRETLKFEADFLEELNFSY